MRRKVEGVLSGRCIENSRTVVVSGCLNEARNPSLAGFMKHSLTWLAGPPKIRIHVQSK